MSKKKIDEKVEIKINAACGCIENNGIWFVHYVLNLLFFYDFSKKKIIFSTVIPTKSSIDPVPYLAMASVNNKIYLFSNNADKSFVYDIEKDYFEEIKLKEVMHGGFRAAYVVGDYIYAVPFWYKNIVKYDTRTGIVDYLDGISSLLGKEQFYINDSCLVEEEKIVVAVPNIGTLLEFDLKSEKWNTYSKECSGNYSSVIYKNGVLLAFDLIRKRVVAFDNKKNIVGETGKMTDYSVSLSDLGNQFWASNDTKTGIIQIWDTGFTLNYLIEPQIDINDLTTEYLDGIWVFDACYSYGITKSSELILFDRSENKVISRSKISCIVPTDYLADFMKIDPNKINIENTFRRLSDFIDYIV